MQNYGTMGRQDCNRQSVSWLISGQLAKSYLPDHADLLEWKRSGIQSVANLLESYYAEVAKQELLQGFHVLHSPIGDMCAPSLDQLRIIIRWIDREICSRRRVLVHCFAGIGRTGIILAAYLMHTGKPFDDALNTVLSVGSKPQTQEQFDILHAFSIGQKETRAEDHKATQ